MSDHNTFEHDCNAAIALLSQTLQERATEAALVAAARSTGSNVCDLLEALARILARTAQHMGDGPKGGALAYHALAIHATALSLEEALTTCERAHTEPTSWV